MSGSMAQLRERLATLEDLQHAASLMSWDQQTLMPSRGAHARAEALATLSRASHELFISPETGELLQAAGESLQ